jgi:hypothetical protein
MIAKILSAEDEYQLEQKLNNFFKDVILVSPEHIKCFLFTPAGGGFGMLILYTPMRTMGG